MAVLPVSLQGPPRDKRPRFAQRAEPRWYCWNSHRAKKIERRPPGLRAEGFRVRSSEPPPAPRSTELPPKGGRGASVPFWDSLQRPVSGKAREGSQQPCRVAQAQLRPHAAPRSPLRRLRLLFGQRAQPRPGAGRKGRGAASPLSAWRCLGTPTRPFSLARTGGGRRRSSFPVLAAERGLQSGQPDCRTHHPQLGLRNPSRPVAIPKGWLAPGRRRRSLGRGSRCSSDPSKLG